MKKTILRSLACVALLALPASLPAQIVSLPEASPAATISQTIGITTVTVDYHRPSANGRVIWGELVPYGLNDLGWAGATQAPWRAGANENTIVSFQHDASVEGQPLPAGDYGLHMIIHPDDTATVIFSQNATSWGSYFYDPAEDALRATVDMQDAPHQEQLSYRFENVTNTSATLSLHWAEKRIPISLAVDTDAIVLQTLKDEMRSAKGFRYQNLMDAANYLVAHDLELEQALEWVEIAISRPFVGRKVKETLELKRVILEKLGRPAEAAKVKAEIDAL